MPYFKAINLLFIHIPKTGGSSVEDYIEQKYKINLSTQTLFSRSLTCLFYNHTLHHSTYKELFKHKNDFDIDFNNIIIFTIVRNPYDRIISELFFIHFIKLDELNKLNNVKNKQSYILEKINFYLKSDNNYDNHKLPQYLYILDENNEINKNIIILKNENLNEEIKNIYFPNFNIDLSDFNFNSNKTHRNEIDYKSLLNKESIDIINLYYSKDFEYFNYDKIA